MDRLFEAADRAIEDGYTIIILSDRGVDEKSAPIPALLAVAGLHHHLIRCGARTKVGIALESGEPREVHHFCLLIGYGVQAVNPYMAFESLADMIAEGQTDRYRVQRCGQGIHQISHQRRRQGHGEDGNFNHQVVSRGANL